MSVEAPRAEPGPPRWIVSRGFDLAWFFGGAAIGLTAVALALMRWVPLIPLVWGVYLVIDGSHFAAAYTRTYADPVFLRERRALALGTLAAFAAGPLSLALGVAFRSDLPWLGFLAGSTMYAVYHLVRQHYGFLALYKSVNNDRGDVVFDRWCLYLGCWLPYVHFLVTHPRARVAARLAAEPSLAESRLAAAIQAAWLVVVVAFVARAAVRARTVAVLQKVLYALSAFAMYAITYWAVARFEPFYQGATTPDQDFLLIAIMVSVFHGVQYIGLVWFHNKRRYSGAPPEHGAASWINRSLPRYLLVCLAITPVYWLVAYASGLFPGYQGLVGMKVGPVTANQLAICVWWGLAVHHYALDQYIWRVRKDAPLRKALLAAG